jgi:hypothetical protein
LKTILKGYKMKQLFFIILAIIAIIAIALPVFAEDAPVYHDGFNLSLKDFGAGLAGSPSKIMRIHTDWHVVGFWKPFRFALTSPKTGEHIIGLSPIIMGKDLESDALFGPAITCGDDVLCFAFGWNKRSGDLFLSSSWPIDEFLKWVGLARTNP